MKLTEKELRLLDALIYTVRKDDGYYVGLANPVLHLKEEDRSNLNSIFAKIQKELTEVPK